MSRSDTPSLWLVLTPEVHDDDTELLELLKLWRPDATGVTLTQEQPDATGIARVAFGLAFASPLRPNISVGWQTFYLIKALEAGVTLGKNRPR